MHKRAYAKFGLFWILSVLLLFFLVLPPSLPDNTSQIGTNPEDDLFNQLVSLLGTFTAHAAVPVANAGAATGLS